MAPVVPISMAPVVPTPVAMFGCPLAAVAAPFPTIIVVSSVTIETNLSGRPIGWICQRRRCKPGCQEQLQNNLFHIMTFQPSGGGFDRARSEEHTSELQSLMRISYAVLCLKKKKEKISDTHTTYHITTNNP